MQMKLVSEFLRLHFFFSSVLFFFVRLLFWIPSWYWEIITQRLNSEMCQVNRIYCVALNCSCSIHKFISISFPLKSAQVVLATPGKIPNYTMSMFHSSLIICKKQHISCECSQNPICLTGHISGKSSGEYGWKTPQSNSGHIPASWHSTSYWWFDPFEYS